jgi:hypothetical protein
MNLSEVELLTGRKAVVWPGWLKFVCLDTTGWVAGAHHDHQDDAGKSVYGSTVDVLILSEALKSNCNGGHGEVGELDSSRARLSLSGINGMPLLGDTVSMGDFRLSDSSMLAGLISSADIEELFAFELEGCQFELALDESNRVKYVGTSDTNLVSVEGVRIGTILGEAARLAGSQVIYEPGWAVYVPLRDGWNAACGVEDRPPDSLQPRLETMYFFRRR